MAVDTIAVGATPVTRPRRLTEGRVVLGAALVVYLALACWMWRQQFIPQDSLSRLANGYYVLFSRDPHLAAVGIVWNPLPSLALLPFLPLGALVPALVRDGLVAVLVSAGVMAVTVAVTRDILRRLGVSRTPRLILTGLFALHPMIFWYAGNGMSEALFLVALMLATRSLLQWLADGRPERLVALGLALGLAYGSRYEALAPALAAPVAVFGVSWWRNRGRESGRLGIAQADAVLAGFPALVTVGLWAACGRIVDNQWFATFSSKYGNAAQVAANRAAIESVTGSTLADRAAYAAQQLAGLEPLAPAVLLVAAVLAVRWRDARALAPVAVLGSVLAFDNLAFLLGSSFGWLRFQIAVVPLVVVLVGILLSRQGPARGPGPRRAAVVAGLLAAALAVPVTVLTLRNPDLAREESAFLTAGGAEQTRFLARQNLRIGAEIDGLGLPDGAVLTDSAYSYAVILASRHPKQFVISSDRDFAAILADPKGHGVRYYLVSAGGAADAVRAAYPALEQAPASRTWPDFQGRALFTLVPVS
ncbi:hypothetical protein [Dactylosporangium darangshiense]|uniref:Glycosyltransferase RgtA/B/C/D-like domain-containing protein n=1 Tax=Dactylosporangium darangshiense TaxID=579108 RepID=A0ABP8CYS6_9ACTN